MMSSNPDSNHNTEQVVAIAAAAYAINLIAEPSIRDKKTSVGLEPSLVKDKSRKEDSTFSILKPGTVSERLTGEGSTKGSEGAESKVPVTNATDERATTPAPSFKKPLTLADQLGSTSSTKPRSSPKPDTLSSQPESAEPKPDLSTIKPVRTAPKPDHPTIKPGTEATRPEQLPTIKPVAPGIEAKRQSEARLGTEKTNAEAWEKA